VLGHPEWLKKLRLIGATQPCHDETHTLGAMDAQGHGQSAASVVGEIPHPVRLTQVAHL